MTLLFLLALAADETAPPKIDAMAQAEYQTLRARLAEAQTVFLQRESALKAWLDQKRLACQLELRDGDQIACAAPKPEPKPKEKP